MGQGYRKVFNYRSARNAIAAFLVIALSLAVGVGVLTSNAESSLRPLGIACVPVFLLGLACGLRVVNERVAVDGDWVERFDLFGRRAERCPLSGLEHRPRSGVSVGWLAEELVCADGTIRFDKIINSYPELIRLPRLPGRSEAETSPGAGRLVCSHSGRGMGPVWIAGGMGAMVFAAAVPAAHAGHMLGGDWLKGPSVWPLYVVSVVLVGVGVALIRQGLAVIRERIVVENGRISWTDWTGRERIVAPIADVRAVDSYLAATPEHLRVYKVRTASGTISFDETLSHADELVTMLLQAAYRKGDRQ